MTNATETEVEQAEDKIEHTDVEACFADDELDWSKYRRMQEVAVSTDGNRRLFEQLTDAIDADSSTVAATKKGACLYILGQISAARETLKKAHPASEMASVILGNLFEDQERTSAALEVFAEAAKSNPDNRRAVFGVIKSNLIIGERDAALEMLKDAETRFSDDPELRFLHGFAAELDGEYHKAKEHFEQVLETNDSHPRALFRLARYHSSWGEEEKAVEYYERCCSMVPTYGNALINLGLLYEDQNRWEDAIRCYQTVLKAIPGHPRATMFLKDAQASTNMYYDEERERRHDRQMAVLGIPVSDFELSVRSRNCLNKMNIKTLGDLMAMTEHELLAHKNFGETSLMEVKQMLAQKGLRLGQNRAQLGGFIGQVKDTTPKNAQKDDLMKQSVSVLELSVRSRNCMNRLQIRTVGELVSRSEQELLSAKNFGETSLNEIKTRLKELGLGLKGS